MPCSMLKLYTDIIKTLIENGPLSLNELAQFLNAKPSTLKKPLSFFSDQALIRKKTSNSIVTYTTAKRGLEILRFFKIQPLMNTKIDEP